MRTFSKTVWVAAVIFLVYCAFRFTIVALKSHLSALLACLKTGFSGENLGLLFLTSNFINATTFWTNIWFKNFGVIWLVSFWTEPGNNNRIFYSKTNCGRRFPNQLGEFQSFVVGIRFKSISFEIVGFNFAVPWLGCFISGAHCLRIRSLILDFSTVVSVLRRGWHQISSTLSDHCINILLCFLGNFNVNCQIGYSMIKPVYIHCIQRQSVECWIV